MIGIQMRLLLKSKLRVALIILLFVIGIAYNISSLRYFGIEDIATWGADGFLFKQLKICYFIFVFMSLISFDYYSERRGAKLEDVIAIQKRTMRTDIEMGGLLLMIPILYQIVMSVFSVIVVRFGKSMTKDMIIYILKMWGCYSTLCGATAITLGCYLAKWKQKLLGYVSIVLFCLLLHYQLQISMMASFGNGENVLGKVLRVLYLMPCVETSMDGSVTVLGYGHLYPVQLFQIAPFLFWIGIFVLGSIRRNQMRFRKLLLVCCGIVIVGSIGVLCLYSPNEYMSTQAKDDTSCWGEEHGYYMMDEENVITKYEKPSYKVSSYGLDVTPGWQMRITATIMLEGDENKYPMTLYHLFRIQSVRDTDGNKLRYQRDGDYLTIEADKPVKGIVVQYYGGGSKYYCNHDNISLFGSFPYYPTAGFWPVYDLEMQEMEDCSLKEEVPFEVTVHSGQTIYCNLPEVGKNHFVGVAKSVDLVSGFFESKQMKNGVTVVYSYLYPNVNPLLPENEKIIDEMVDYMLSSGKWDDTNGKYIFIGIYTSVNKYTTDSIVTYQDTWEDLYKRNFCESDYRLDEDVEKEKTFQFYFALEDEDAEETEAYNEGEEIPYKYSYEELKELFCSIWNCFDGVTEEDFDAYILEHFGEEQLKIRKGE